MSAGHIAHIAHKLVEAANKTVDDHLPDEIAGIVKTHAAGAAAACIAGGWLPGVGALAAAGVCAGFVWTMYGRINSKLGLTLSDNILKTLATGIATNLATGFAGAFVMQTVLSFIPGIGSVGAAAVAGGTGYGLTLAAGYIYMKVLTNLFLSGKDPSTMDAEALKKAAKDVAATENIKQVIKDAKAEYKPGSK